MLRFIDLIIDMPPFNKETVLLHLRVGIGLPGPEEM